MKFLFFYQKLRANGFHKIWTKLLYKYITLIFCYFSIKYNWTYKHPSKGFPCYIWNNHLHKVLKKFQTWWQNSTLSSEQYFCLLDILWGSPIYLFSREREEGREIEKQSICCSTYLCIHWLISVCALTGDRTHNLGALGWPSNLLSYLGRVLFIFIKQ